MKLNFSKKGGAPKSKAATEELNGWLAVGFVVLIGAFCLYGSKTLLAKVMYQQKVLSASHKAQKQLETNLKNSQQLSAQYAGLFENDNPANFLGGKSDAG